MYFSCSRYNFRRGIVIPTYGMHTRYHIWKFGGTLLENHGGGNNLGAFVPVTYNKR